MYSYFFKICFEKLKCDFQTLALKRMAKAQESGTTNFRCCILKRNRGKNKKNGLVWVELSLRQIVLLTLTTCIRKNINIYNIK
jgi:hypothetical protein